MLGGKKKQKYGTYLLSFALAKFIFTSCHFFSPFMSDITLLSAGWDKRPAQDQESKLKVDINSYSFHFYYLSDANMYWNLHKAVGLDLKY